MLSARAGTNGQRHQDEHGDADRPVSQLPLGVCIGLLVGVVLGVVMDNIALGMAVGLTVGIAWGVSAASISRTTDHVHRRRIEDRW